MGAWNADTRSWDKEPGWLRRLIDRVSRTPNVQRNRALGWRIWFRKYGGFSRPFDSREAAEAAKLRIMAGEDVKSEFWGSAPTPTPAPVAVPKLSGPVTLQDVRFTRRTMFRLVESDLPDLFHRPSGHALVLREPREVRFFGDPDIARRGLIVNSYPVSGIETWQDGWHGYFAEDVTVEMVAQEDSHGI